MPEAKKPKKLPVLNNALLSKLDAKTVKRLQSGFEPVTLKLGDLLCEPGQIIEHAYFPTGGLISLLAMSGAGNSLEVALVGREGLFGVPLALGVRDSSVRALVQGTGPAFRISAAHFQREIGRSLTLKREVLRYAHGLMGQMAQNAACNRFHVVESRLARWLHMTYDRLLTLQFTMTQEFLASLLGVRRVGVTEAAGALRKRNLIEYSRGTITIIDRKGLRAAACDCYEVNRRREKAR